MEDTTYFFSHDDVIGRTLGGGMEGEESFGVHVDNKDDPWKAMVYLAVIWVLGFIGEKVLLMPALVGQIFAGIICGPELLDIVPVPEAFVLFGEIGLTLLVVEAGVDIDVMTLKLIGKRGVVIAFLGSVFPIGIGIGIAYLLGAETKSAIAAGAAFGPTSLGIAMNILRTGKILNTPTGQLIVAAAIIDDMIALIILSQLEGLVGEPTTQSIVQPIAVAIGLLVIGGYAALFLLPNFLDSYIFAKTTNPVTHGKLALGIMLSLMIGLYQVALVTKASALMGAFLAGLVFCTDHHLHVSFVSQFKRVLQWLLRIFFASTIGFQVPITKFGDGKIIWQGLVFTLALLGKLGVGFLVPNFTRSAKFTGNHLRDCLIVGCSMAAEGEFAFVIASFAVTEKIIDVELYSSIVLAILLSTIIAPFSLRFTINYFNKKNLREIEQAEILQAKTGDIDEDLKAGILHGSTVFFCINTTSHGAWGTLPRLMNTLFELELEIIDHRSWHCRFEDTVVNEVYVKDNVAGGTDLDQHIQEIFDKVSGAIDQKDAVISVSRWTPGIIDNLDSEHHLADKLVEEARERLEHSVDVAAKTDKVMMASVNAKDAPAPSRAPRRRVRIVSTPAGGGDLFGTDDKFQPNTIFRPSSPVESGPVRRRRNKTLSTPISGDMFGDTSPVVLAPGEVLVNIVEDNGQKFPIKIDQETLKKIKDSIAPLGVTEVKKNADFVGQFLEGFIRKDGGNNMRTRSSVSSAICE